MKMKWVSFWIVVAASVFIVAASVSSTRGTVVAIAKTSSYHRPECFRVHMAKTERLTKEEARQKNLKPCPTCNPEP